MPWIAAVLLLHDQGSLLRRAHMVCHLSHLFLPLHPGAHHCLSSILLLVLCTTGTGHRHRPTAIPCRCTPHWAPCLVSPRQSFPASPFHRPLAHMAAKTKPPHPSHFLRLPLPAILPIHQHLAPQPHQTMPHPILPTLYLYPKTGLDTRRSIGNLSCPRFVVSSSWAREKGLAGIPVTSLHPAHFLYQGWNSYWLRWIAAGKEAYFIVARTKAEMVLAGELLSQIRAQGLDIDAAATNLAVQTQASQAKSIAVKALGQFLVDQVKSKIPVETDYESHARIRELEGQIGSLQQQLKQQQQSASVPSANNTGVGAPGPSTPPPPRGSNADRSPLATPAESSSPGSSAKPNTAPALAGQNLRQLPLQFSPGSNLGTPAKPEPSSIMQPPQEGSPWLASHFPAKCHDKELKAWINSLTLNDRKKSELQEWLKQVEDWVEAQDTDDFLTKIRRTAVIWGVPPATGKMSLSYRSSLLPNSLQWAPTWSDD